MVDYSITAFMIYLPIHNESAHVQIAIRWGVFRSRHHISVVLVHHFLFSFSLVLVQGRNFVLVISTKKFL